MTTNAYRRMAFFRDAKVAERLARIIHASCLLKHFTALAFCIMPDHVHLLVQKYDSSGERGALEKAPLVKVEPTYVFQSALSRARRKSRDHRNDDIAQLMQSIKGTFSRSMEPGAFWQPRYYCRVVTTEQALRNILRYIKWNHQKHRLSDRFGKEPYVFVRKGVTI